MVCVHCLCVFVCGGGATNESTGSRCYLLQDCNYFWVYKEGQLLGRCCTKTSFNAGAGTSCTPKMIAGVCGRKPSRCFIQDELRNSYRLKHVCAGNGCCCRHSFRFYQNSCNADFNAAKQVGGGGAYYEMTTKPRERQQPRG